MKKLKKQIIIAIIIMLLSMDILNLYSGLVYALSKNIEENCIIRAYPNTTVGKFKDDNGKDIIVYEDETKEKEVTSGIVKTR